MKAGGKIGKKNFPWLKFPAIQYLMLAQIMLKIHLYIYFWTISMQCTIKCNIHMTVWIGRGKIFTKLTLTIPGIW